MITTAVTMHERDGAPFAFLDSGSSGMRLRTSDQRISAPMLFAIKAVPEIVDAHVVETGARPDAPRTGAGFGRGAGAGILT